MYELLILNSKKKTLFVFVNVEQLDDVMVYLDKNYDIDKSKEDVYDELVSKGFDITIPEVSIMNFNA